MQKDEDLDFDLKCQENIWAQLHLNQQNGTHLLYV